MLSLEIMIAITRRSPYNIYSGEIHVLTTSYFRAQDAPHSLGGDLGTQFSWYVGYLVIYIFGLALPLKEL